MIKKIKAYRIRHKQTGLYYRPGSGDNLNEEGKLYFKKRPSLNMINFIQMSYKQIKELEEKGIKVRYTDDHKPSWMTTSTFLYFDSNDLEVEEYDCEIKLTKTL